MHKKKLVIGTRGSSLALWQTEFVRDRLADLFPDLKTEVKIIKTTGDKLLDVALSKIGDKGLFTKQLELELLDGGIDIAVHSLKDLQTEQPEGLAIGAVLEREIPNDVFISNRYSAIDELPNGATVATGSLRRRSQLLNYRRDLQIVEIRGNVPTRLEKFDALDFDGMILAYAGMHRLGFDDRIAQKIPFEVLLPAVGQGAMAIEARSDDTSVNEIIKALEHPETRACVTAERSFLRALEGGCQVPIAGYATIDGESVTLQGMAGSLDGVVNFRRSMTGPVVDASDIGSRLAAALIEEGASEVLAASRAGAEQAGGAAI